MFKDIKLTTINKLIASALILSCAVLGVSAFIIEKNITLIDDTWRQYQADRSDKARLENALRTAIGYGGMVHEFKNFILRHKPSSMAKIHRHIGAAESILNQYRLLELSDAETTALDDIHEVIKIYEEHHFTVSNLINLEYSIPKIDTLVKIDETPVLRGLETLRHEVLNSRDSRASLSRARVSADLRGAIGYGGMIHHYKNYLLRADLTYKDNAKQSFKEAYSAIKKYRNLKPTYAEKLALNDIESVLNSYAKNLDVMSQLIHQKKSIHEIDLVVSVDDHLLLRGLNTLDKAIHDQIDSNNIGFSQALILLKSTSEVVTGGLLIFLISVFIFGVWLMKTKVMSPMLRLTKNMIKLSHNDFSIILENEDNDNELGDIARAMSVFKKNMIERHEAGLELEKANNELNLQLDNVVKLKEQSEQQTSKALALAEGLADARQSAEKSTRKAEENELRVSSILNAVQDAIITINHKGIIESINPATENMFGYKSIELINQNISFIVPEPHKNQHDNYITNYIEHGTIRDISKPIEQIAYRKDGSTFIMELFINTIVFSNEKKIIGVIKDVTERKQWEVELKKLAMEDPLTGLANRNQYVKKLSDAAAISLRNEQPFALILLDIDKFKPVNDQYGHQIGDLLLQHIAKTLLACSRETDTVARLGGDEFAIILPPSNQALDTNTLAQRIIDQVSKPCAIEGHSIQVGISIGISIFPTFADDLEVLQSQADTALYQAKEGGRNTFRVFE